MTILYLTFSFLPLHLINTGLVGESLNSEETFDPGPAGEVTVFEIDRIDFLHDQRFLAELVLMQMWQRDRIVCGTDCPIAGKILNTRVRSAVSGHGTS